MKRFHKNLQNMDNTSPFECYFGITTAKMLYKIKRTQTRCLSSFYLVDDNANGTNPSEGAAASSSARVTRASSPEDQGA